MFDKRPDNIKIDFISFGNVQNLPTGNVLQDGDTVILTFKNFEITVDNINALPEKKYAGIVESISKNDADIQIDELGIIRKGNSIEFFDENVFSCIRMS